jgi:hypothetical protein
MAEPKHYLEDLADELGERLKEAVDAAAEELSGPNGRPLFTKRMSKPEALAWWQRNRYNKIGEQALAGMTPEQQMEVDQMLSQANAATMYGDLDG